ncbi:uroporphyrinogen-III C-methyltransferase [Endozoicomonadaceae bacterium StTr2]
MSENGKESPASDQSGADTSAKNRSVDNQPEVSKEVSKDVPQTSGTPKKKKTSAQSARTGKSGGNSLAVLSLVVSLAALGGAGAIGWYGYKAQQQLVALEQQTVGNKAQSQHIEKSSADLQQQLQQLQQSVKSTLESVPKQEQQQREQMNVVLDQLESLSKKIRELQGSNRESWLLAEAEYLMRLANQRLRTEGDVKSAETLLLDADQLIVSIDDYSLFPVREALAEDITALKSVPALDRDGLWLQLTALEKQIAMLPVVPAEIPAAPGSSGSIEYTQPAAEESSDAALNTADMPWYEVWKGKLANSVERAWNVFSTQFRITRRDAPVEPLPSVDDEIALRLNARLMLEQARLAMLQGRKEVYVSSLQQASEWVERYFSHDKPKSQAIIDQLAELQKMPIEQRLPDVSRGLSRLKVYLDDIASDRRLPLQQPQAQKKPEPAAENNGAIPLAEPVKEDKAPAETAAEGEQ